jgi:predicted GNAT family acetyltransferase
LIRYKYTHSGSEKGPHFFNIARMASMTTEDEKIIIDPTSVNRVNYKYLYTTGSFAK